MSPDAALALLQRWRDAGALRPLPLALARLVHELDRAAPGSLLVATALLVQLEGRGHSCLPLADLQPDPSPLLDAAVPALPEPGLPIDAAAARAVWPNGPALEVDPLAPGGATPLVLAGGRLYLRRYWRCESQVAAQVTARSAQALDGVDADAVRARLDTLFADTAAVDWQKVACALALRARLTLITGGPGTGKTHTAARLLVLLQSLHAGAQPLRVALAAPTGKAASRLRQSIELALQGLPAAARERAAPAGPARTLHALLGTRPGSRRFVHDAANPLDVDLLFVDEASMVHLEMMAALLDALPPTARLVLLGDKDQLASVEAGAVLGDLCADAATGEAHAYDAATCDWLRRAAGVELPPARVPGDALAQQTVTLRHSRRFDGPIGALAAAVNRGDAASAAALLSNPEDGSGAVALCSAADARAVAALALGGRPAAAAPGYRDYLEWLRRRPADSEAAGAFDTWARRLIEHFEAVRVLCALRDGPWGASGLNAAIEQALGEAGLPARRGAWYEGRPVMVTRNDAGLGVFNGDIGIVLRPPGGGGLRAWFADGPALRSVSVARLADVETAFAMTVHKSQGSEFAHVLLVLPDHDAAVLTRELVYTGITRARRAFTLVVDDVARLGSASQRLTRRTSGLPALLARTTALS